MKNFRKADFLVLAGLLAVVIAVFAAGTAEAGCYGGGRVIGNYGCAPVTTYCHRPWIPTYNCFNYNPWWYNTCYAPCYTFPNFCGGLYW